MKSLFHLFYFFCLVAPLFLNVCLCFASYRWHTRFRMALIRELEAIRKGRGVE
jgi:hypothetical protein